MKSTPSDSSSPQPILLLALHLWPPCFLSLMGFPSVHSFFSIWKQLLMLLFFLDCILFAITMAFYYIGLYPSNEAPRTPSWDDVFNLSATNLTESKSFPVTASEIKLQLPVVQFTSFVKRTRGALQIEGEEPVCSVCLAVMEGRDEIRDLGNCCHAFHKGCIDRWMDIGQQTCPVCRSQLLPRKRRRGKIEQLLGLWQKVW